MSHIQAVLFDTQHKREAWNTSDARVWLARHKLKPIKKVHETENFLHYRIREPDEEKYKYRTIRLGSGIEMIIEFPKKEKVKDLDHPNFYASSQQGETEHTHVGELSNESDDDLEKNITDLASAAIIAPGFP